MSFVPFLGKTWYEQGYVLSACLFFPKISMQTLKGAEEQKGFLYKHNFHLHLFVLFQNVLKIQKSAACSKAFSTFESMQTLWGKISIATELKGGKYEKSVLDKYMRRYVYLWWERSADYERL